ncbi:unnamed protein product, partial [Phaeothamnion confervicola]
MEAAFVHISDDVRSLWAPSSIRRIAWSDICGPEGFHRSFVASSTPVIITGAMDDWRALSEWSIDGLQGKVGDVPVTVNVTPDGHGDCVKPASHGGDELKSVNHTPAGPEVFVKPEERRMTFSEFAAAMQSPASFAGVPYLSHQNDNLRSELSALEADVGRGVADFAEAVFGCRPD